MLRWGGRAVLSVVMARLMSLRAVVEEHEGKADLDTEDGWGSIENLGGEDRFRLPLAALDAETGLCRNTVIAAKRELQRRKIVCWQRDSRPDGGDAADILYPNAAFRVKVTPTSPGLCRVDF